MLLVTAVDWVFQTRTLLRAILHNPKVLPVVVGRTGVHGEMYNHNDGRYDVRSKEKVRWEPLLQTTAQASQESVRSQAAHVALEAAACMPQRSSSRQKKLHSAAAAAHLMSGHYASWPPFFFGGAS